MCPCSFCNRIKNTYNRKNDQKNSCKCPLLWQVQQNDVLWQTTDVIWNGEEFHHSLYQPLSCCMYADDTIQSIIKERQTDGRNTTDSIFLEFCQFIFFSVDRWIFVGGVEWLMLGSWAINLDTNKADPVECDVWSGFHRITIPCLP